MKEIVDAENKTRRVQPKDFVFLSEADKQIVSAMEMMLKSVYGVPDGYAIVLGGLLYTASTGVVTDGKVLYNGCLYEISGGQFEAGVSVGNIPSKPVELYLNLFQKTVEPSPVENKNGEKTIECHKSNYGEISSAAEERCLFSSSLNAIDRRVLYLTKLGDVE